MKALDAKLLQKFLKLAVNRLKGEWLLIGGTVLPLLGVDLRTTTDIDLLPLGKQDSNSSVLELMKLAEELDLPIETLNQAGLYFLEKLTDYRDCLVILKRSPTTTIYRPDINLYLRLKLKRLSESDCSDCLAFIQYAKKAKEQINTPLLIQEVQKELKKAGTTEAKTDRLNLILKSLRS